MHPGSLGIPRDIPQTRFHVTCFFMHVHCITSCTVTMVTLTWNIWSFLCDKFLLIIKINVVLLTFNWTKKLEMCVNTQAIKRLFLCFIRAMNVHLARMAELKKIKREFSPVDQTNTPPNSDILIYICWLYTYW